MQDVKKESNGWFRSIIIGLITVALSVGGSIWGSGETVGQYKEKVDQLEVKQAKVETLYSTDHDLLIEINTKLKSIEDILKQIQENRNFK